MSLIGTARNHV